MNEEIKMPNIEESPKQDITNIIAPSAIKISTNYLEINGFFVKIFLSLLIRDF